MKNFPKDKWILSAIKNKYLVVFEDGEIWRAKKSNKDGSVPANVEYSIVKPQTHKKTGRVYFNITYRGFTKSVLVNRVVALRYLPNPENLPQVNHIDGDKQNNALKNPDGSMQLEWCSGSDNERHAHKTGLKTGRGSSNSNSKLTAKQVYAIRDSDKTVSELATHYGVSRSTITNVRQRKTWRHV